MAKVSKNDLTCIYYTANKLPQEFARAVRRQLTKAITDTGIVGISLTNKPPSVAWNGFTSYGFEDREELPYGHASIYRLVLLGAKIAKTKYVALCEDDVLYSPEHFKFRPKQGHWGYNMNAWNMYTWGEPMFSYKAPGGRRNLSQLICEREMLIEHLEQRFYLHPDDSKINPKIFGEPGKYDNQLGTAPYPSEDFYTNPPNVVFSHQANLQFKGLGTRKALGQIRATEISYWGKADKIRALYE